MIKLTSAYNGDPIWVNSAFVVQVTGQKGTQQSHVSTVNTGWVVAEPPEVVVSLLERTAR